MFVPSKIRMPVPVWVRLPLPLMSVVAERVTLSPWLKIRLPLSKMLLVAPIEAPLPPLPICSEPAAIVVAPMNVLLPVSVRTPVPACVRLPLPLIAPANEEARGRRKSPGRC